MRVFVTGATGFIGRQLTRDLIQRGEHIRVLARDGRKARQLFGNNVDVSVGDLGNRAAIKEACRDIDVIYHIGGIYRFGLRHRGELFQSRPPPVQFVPISGSRGTADDARRSGRLAFRARVSE